MWKLLIAGATFALFMLVSDDAQTVAQTVSQCPVILTPPSWPGRAAVWREPVNYKTIVDLMAADARFRGPRGYTGAAGAPGKPVIDYKLLREILAADTRFRSAEIDYGRLAQMVANDPRFDAPAPPVPSPPASIYIESAPAHAFEGGAPTLPNPPTPAAASAKGEFNVSWLQIGLLAAGAAGVGLPLWLIRGLKVGEVAVRSGGAIVHRRRERRRESGYQSHQTPQEPPRQETQQETQETPSPQDNETSERSHGGRQWNPGGSYPVTVATPPPPQVMYTRNEYIDVERDTFAQCYSAACADLVRKFPGNTGSIETLDNLIDQHLAGRGLTWRRR